VTTSSSSASARASAWASSAPAACSAGLTGRPARFRAATGTAISTRTVFDLAAQGVPAAVTVVEEHGRYLALAISAVTAVLDPALVVLGGGVGSRTELLEPVRAGLADLGKAPVEVRTSALGSRAAVVGALNLALSAALLDPDWEDNR
jgi:glucokinase